ncbi:MAG: DUF2085 domain-containing protein [Ktedonobacterales bacterium]
MDHDQPSSDGQGHPASLTREEMDYVLAGIGPRRKAFSDAVTHGAEFVGGWLQRHWLAVVNGALLTYIGLALVTPVAFALGFNGPAADIFHIYRFFCDQLPTHSFFIFGYQVCLCERCLAIYTSMLISGLTLALVRKRRSLPSITWWMWVIAMIPMALDGGTQLFGLRESNVWLRLLTGSIFGIGTAMFTLPQIEKASKEAEHHQPAAG